MDEIEQNCIQRNIKNLSENTTNIYELVTILFSAGILTESQMEIINSKSSTYQKCFEFYVCLLRKGTETYHVLLDALKSTDNFYAYELLQNVIKQNFFGYNKCVSNFMGREVELEKIRNVLVNKHQVIVSGIGGIGKTSLAEKYIELYKGYYQNRIVWIDGTNNVGCRTTLENYLTNSHYSNKTEAALIHQLYNLYNKDKKPWLLVMDNITKFLEDDTIRSLFRKQHGDVDYSHLFITCLEGKAVSNHTTLVNEVQIGGLSIENAIFMLSGGITQPVHGNSSSYLKQLASILCCSPLALQQAFAYLETEYMVLNSSEEKCKYYLEEIMDQAKGYQRILGNSTHGSNKTINAVIDLAVSKVKLGSDGYIASNLLQNLSYLGPRKIDIKIIPHLLKNITADQNHILRAVNNLAKFKLIDYRKDFIDIHEVVQLHIRHHMEGNGLLQLTGSKRLHNCIFGLYDSIADVSNVHEIIPHILAVYNHTGKYCTSTIFSSLLILLTFATLSEISDNLMRQMLSPFIHEKSFQKDIIALTVSFLIISIMLVYAVNAYTRLNGEVKLHRAMLISGIILLSVFQIVQIFGIWDYDRFKDSLITLASIYKLITTLTILSCACLWYVETVKLWRKFTNVVNQVNLLFFVNWILGALVIFAELYVYLDHEHDSDENKYKFYDPFSIPKVSILLATTSVIFIISTYFEIICKVPAPQFSIIGKPKALFHFSLSCFVFEMCALVWKIRILQRRDYTLGLVVLLLTLLITIPIFVQKKNEYSLDFVIWNLGLNDKKRLYSLLNHNHPDLFEVEEHSLICSPQIEDDEKFLQSVYNKLGKNHKKSKLSLYMCEKLSFMSYQNSHYEVAKNYYENIAMLPEATPKQIYNYIVIHFRINSSSIPQNLIDRLDNFVVENSPLVTPALQHKFNFLKSRFLQASILTTREINDQNVDANELQVVIL